MILIADSGSTKTDWRLIEGKKNIHQFSTIGFSPYFQDSDTIAEEIKGNLLPGIKALSLDEQDEMEIYFYGTGCSSEEKCEVVHRAIRQNFPNSIIEVEHDLLGAARALCGENEGIAAILGTGSNSCYYDGNKIIENIASLGFILGDEGSGAYMGKVFIQDYLNKEQPLSISERFYERFKLSKEDILNAVYKKPLPNKFLASFTKFIFQNKNEQYIINLVIDCFDKFFIKHICKYTNYKEVKMSCVGSVGYYFSDTLHAVASNRNVLIDKIIESPIASLTLYHIGE